MELTKIQPQVIDLETAVLGAILLEDCISEVEEILSVESFYDNRHKIIYQCCLNLKKVNSPIDILTVTQEVKRLGNLEYVGGAYFISTLTANVAGSHRIQHHAQIIEQKHLQRKLINLAADTLNLAYSENDIFETIQNAELKLSQLVKLNKNDFKQLGDVYLNLLSETKEVLENGKPTGLASGLKDLDNITGGWQKGNLIILAARPGMGKTATALQFAKFPAFELNKPVGIFSLEMTAQELVGRLASSEGNINSTLIQQKRVDRFQFNQLGTLHKMIDAPIYIDETSGLTITELRNRAKKMYVKFKIELLIVDYIQLMKGENEGNREQEINSISRGLKGLAKELGIPIIALSQLSRECEKRSDKRPQLSDLRDSGAIEQDADIVIFLFRPEVYPQVYSNGYEYKGQVIDTRNLMLMDIAKGRAIQTGEVAAKFYGEFMRIDNFSMYEF